MVDVWFMFLTPFGAQAFEYAAGRFAQKLRMCNDTTSIGESGPKEREPSP